MASTLTAARVAFACTHGHTGSAPLAAPAECPANPFGKPCTGAIATAARRGRA